MPFYEYKCSNCGEVTTVLQGMKDAPLTQCPHCGKPALKKQISCSSFELKGDGWFGSSKSHDHKPAGCCPNCPHQH